MFLRKFVTCLFVFFLVVQSSYSQELTINIQRGNEVIPYARVEYDTLKVVANHTGAVTLTLDFTKKAAVKVWGIGYEEKIIEVAPFTGNKELVVQLSPISVFFSDVVVTGSREEENRKEAVVRISALNNVQLQAVSAQNLAEGLSFQPGLRMETNCQNCGFSQLRMNGLDGAYNQFLMNGRPVFSSLNSVYGLEQIPVSWIDRVEVMRGGGSVMYGSNAIAGTVNIITKDPLYTGATAQLSMGYMDGKVDQYAGGSAAWVAKNNKVGVSMSIGQRFREGYDRDNDGFTELPQLQGLAVDVNVFARPSKYSRIGVQLRAMDEFRRGGDQLTVRPEQAMVAEQLESRIYGGEISYEVYLKNRNHKIETYVATQMTNMDNYYGAEMDPDGFGLTKDENYVVGLRHKWGKDTLNNQPRKIKLTSGTEVIRNVLSDSKPGYNVSIFQPISQYGFFSQLDWQFAPKIKLTAGTRLNLDNVVQKPIVTPRIGVWYKLAKFSSIRLNYANGYRIPQVFSGDVHAELVSGEVQVIRLAGDLKHETSHGFNADWSFDVKKGKHDVEFVINGFYNRLNNVFILERTEDVFGQTILEKRNGDLATILGMSYDVSWSWSERMYLQLAFSWQESLYSEPVEWADGQFTSNMLRTPDYYGSMILSYSFTKQFSVNSSLLCTGPMWLPHYEGYIDEDRLERSPLFFDMGLKANYTFLLKKGAKMVLSVGCKNLFDTFQKDIDQGVERDASYVYGPIRPRTYFVSLQIGNLF
jgi:outer membrane receptor for ferrienterochelin and colicins